MNSIFSFFRTPGEPSTLSQPEDHPLTPEDWYKLEIGTSILLLTFFFVIAGSIFLYVYVKRSDSSPSTVSTTSTQISGLSGVVDINGYSPPTATLSIAVKSSDAQLFTIAVSGLKPGQQPVAWNWKEAVAGKAYEVKAILVENKAPIAQSLSKTVTAPAKNISLTLTSSEKPTSTESAIISGTFNIGGYIPAGSTITINAKKPSETRYTMILSEIPAVNNGAWVWDKADAGVSYEFQSFIFNNAQTISNIQIQTITAPAINEIINLNSTAQPDNPTLSTLSGTVQLNGTIPQNSSLTISQRATTSAQFSVFSSIPSATDSASWTWTQATSGQSYEIQATLLTSNGKTVAQSQILLVTAPATNQPLTINIKERASAPALPPTIQCVEKKDSTKKWKITISYKYISSAKQYWIKIGNNSGSYDNILNSRYPATAPSLDTVTVTTDYVLDDNISFYISFAYSTNSSSSDEADFSQFTYTNVIKCQ